MTLSRRQLNVQVLLFFIVVAAGISSAMLLMQGSLTFTAMPLLMALLALGLVPRFAFLAGFVAGAIIVAKTVATAFGLEPLSADEWLRVLTFALGLGAGLAVIAWTRRAYRWWAAVPVLLAAPLFISAAVPLVRSLDTVQRSSVYLPMRDSVKIAADIYLPRGAAGQRLPTLLQQTRYFRRTVLRLPYSLLFGGSIRFDIRRYVSSGYAYVTVDARGSGASFGWRSQEWSDDEIRDGAEVVDWIVSQPWSSGEVGATGISYDGTAAEMLLVNQHPAVKAVAPCFSLLDAYADIALPGGIHLSWFTEAWSRFNDSLDRNALNEQLTGFQKRIIEGVAPVDGQEELLEQAVAEHSKNYSAYNFMLGVTYRDDAAPSGLSMARISPFAKSGIAASGVPIYSYSGWYDGAYHRAAIARFLSYQTPGSRLIIGPWDHGGRQNISSHHPPGTPVFDQVDELIRFFDFHLKGSDNGFGKEKPIRYYTMGEEAWKEAETWPVPGTEFHTLYFAPERALSSAAPVGDAAQDEYKVDLTATTGTGSRWRSYFNTTGAKIGYPNRAEADKKLLVYDSAPLSGDMEITGHPALHLWVSSSALDGQFFAYLEEISPDGKVTHITEGQLRALHRKVSDAVPPYWQPRPFHSFLRADGQPLTPGEPAEISFALLPTSYLVRKGHSLRIALAGADIDQFAPPDEVPAWHVYRDGARASRIVLPVIPAQR